MRKRVVFYLVIILSLGMLGATGGWRLLPDAMAARGKWVAPEDASTVKNPLPHNKKTVHEGKKLYKQNCVACHGKKGRGRGPAAAGLNPKPPRFKNPDVASQPDGVLHWKISHGRTPMPAWAGALSKEELWEIIHYLHTLTGNVPK